ncbi:MAG: hypothetical protein WC285_05280, partial [Candidatus Gracilibacteria bacterium]
GIDPELVTSHEMSAKPFNGNQGNGLESTSDSGNMLYKQYLNDIFAQSKNASNEQFYSAIKALQNDPQLKNLYLEAYRLNSRKDSSSRKEFQKVVGKIEMLFKSYSLSFNVNTLLKSFRYQDASQISVRARIDADKKGKLAEFDKQMKGAKNADSAIAVLDNYVKTSDDADLRKQWQENKKALEDTKKKEENELSQTRTNESSENLATSDQVSASVSEKRATAYSAAGAVITSSGSEYELTNDGTLKFPRGFSVKVEVDDKGQYYFVDNKYSNRGKVGPYGLQEFVIGAYERFIDAYISKKIRGRLTAPDQISEIDDKQLVTVGKALLGREKNGYKVKGEDLMVLDGLIESLLVKDAEYPTLNKKVFALFRRVRKNMNEGTLAISGEASTIRKKLLEGSATGKKYSVSELLGENKTERGYT